MLPVRKSLLYQDFHLSLYFCNKTRKVRSIFCNLWPSYPQLHARYVFILKSNDISKNEQFGKYVSLLPVTPQVSGITLTGMKYPLSDYTMEAYHTIGISNEIIEEEAGISFKEGTLLVLETRD